MNRSLITRLGNCDSIPHPLPLEAHVDVFKVVVPQAILHLGGGDATQPVASVMLLHLVGHLHRCIEQALGRVECLDKGTLRKLDILWAEVELVLYLEVLVGHSVWESETGGECAGLGIHFSELSGGRLKLSLAGVRLV